ncbi:MAG: hypothetical protein AAFR36_32345, partial [Bacteroidota bacterium]
ENPDIHRQGSDIVKHEIDPGQLAVYFVVSPEGEHRFMTNLKLPRSDIAIHEIDLGHLAVCFVVSPEGEHRSMTNLKLPPL